MRFSLHGYKLSQATHLCGAPNAVLLAWLQALPGDA
jgi:hypothetical protein